MPALFPRQIRLVIADDEGTGIDLGRLSSKFEVSRAAQGALGKAKLTVYNLTDDTIGRMSDRYTRIRIDAGYPQRIGTIFSGEIRNVFPTRDGADKVVEIFAGDGARDHEQATVSLSFAAGVSLHEVIRQIAATFTSSALGSLAALTDVKISGPLVLSGMARDALDMLAESYGFRWSIQGGILQVVDRGLHDGQPTLEVSRDTGMIDSPIASTAGIEVLTLLDAGLVPGRRINVTTAGARVGVPSGTLSVVPDFQIAGRRFTEFDVLRVVHVGESRGQPFYTKAFAVPAGRI